MIASDLLSRVLCRWELNPPAIYAQEAYNQLRNVFGVLRAQSIVRQTANTPSVDCTQCGELCEVNYLSDTAGNLRGLICCPYCGIDRVPPRATERWKIDTGAFLAVVFTGVHLAPQERVAGQLWQVGKATWAGRSREVWFARAFQRDGVSDSVKALQGRPKAILFAPTETGAERWRDATNNLVIALESTLAIIEDAIHFDVDYVEGRIVDAGLGPDTAPQPRAKKRASRAANIELLEKEMIKHLQAARDHAFDTLERTGQPELLPRPLRKELGALTGLKKDQVTKCFQDAAARELTLYWDVAADLEQIMKWRGPVKRGRAS